MTKTVPACILLKLLAEGRRLDDQTVKSAFECAVWRAAVDRALTGTAYDDRQAESYLVGERKMTTRLPVLGSEVRS